MSRGDAATFRLDGLEFSLADDPGGEDALRDWLCTMAGPEADQVGPLRILRRSLDARRKNRQLFLYSVLVVLGAGARHALDRAFDAAERPLTQPADQVVDELSMPWSGEGAPAVHPAQPGPAAVVGSGPAGLFAALRLAAAGIAVTLFERGDPVEQRVHRVNRIREGTELDPESNIQFGEGGAGTFSDGKLYSGTSDGRRRLVLRTLAEFGAPPDILYESRPHVGSDRLRGVLLQFRQRLQELGCEFRFRTRVSGLRITPESTDGDTRQLEGLELETGEFFPCRRAVLALGHSARDSFRMLAAAGLDLRLKPFAAGFRVEHPQELIDTIQYGSAGRVAGLPPAEYRVAVKTVAGRGVYSFCMCPGGEVVAAASGPGQSVTNGMSLRARGTRWANSGIVTGIDSAAVGCPAGDEPLAGLRWQEEMEQKAWCLGGSGGLAPAQRVTSFLQGRLDNDLPESSYRPGLLAARLDHCFGEEVTASLREGLRLIDRRMRGFVTDDALLIGVETRTSSPLRCQRDEQGRATGIDGLYPAGEGAGHAGGIISSAVDGLKTAESILEKITSR